MSYEFVEKTKYLPIKKHLINLIKLVQNEVRECFTFQFNFIGSAKYNMITIGNPNKGFDFDIDIRVNDDEENYKAEEIINILNNAFIKQVNENLTIFSFPENSSRVLTIKAVDKQKSKILYSADIAVVFDCENGKQQYIHFNKKKNLYYWNYKKESFYKLDEKILKIRSNS
ncbi:MAG: hypothetical protein K2J69_01840, partial [Malacoplasma sp.]|nr:hypothetical protein [Malacoplasma sp.]